MSEEIKKPISAEDIMLNAFRGEEDVFKEAEDVEIETEEDEEEEEITPDITLEDNIEIESEEEEVEDVEEEEEEEEIIKSSDNDDWDGVDEDEEELPEIGFKEIAAELGYGEVKSKEELVSAIKAKEVSLAEEKAGNDFEGLPEDLLKAIDVVKNGGDYREYLNASSIDYSKVDAKSFFIEAAKEHFTNDDGSLDSESLEDFIEDQDETMMNIQGNAIKKQYVEKQTKEQQLIEANALRRKELTEVKLNDVLSDFKTFNEFKVNESHKKKLYEDITSGKAMKEMFYDKNGQYDMSKVVNAYFYYMKGDQMEKFRAQRAKNTAIREVVKDATNADLKVNGKRVTDNSRVERKEPFDFLAEKYGMKAKV